MCIRDRLQRSVTDSIDQQAGGHTARSQHAHKPVLHGRMDWIAGNEFEFNAGGPTRRRSRNVFVVRGPRPQNHRACSLRDHGRAGIFRLLVARQPEWISLRGLTGGDDESSTPATSGDGTIGNQAHPDRDRDVDRLRAVLPAFSDYD